MSYQRSKERERRLRKLCNETQHSFRPSGVYYDKRKGRYVKYTMGGRKYRKYLKKISSKRARRCKENMKNCEYKKTFDYWWELY